MPSSRYIVSDPDILGGWPVIRGTRLLTSAVARRIAGGDTVAQLEREYPHIPREAFEAALEHEATVEPRPRPAKPWHTT
jgi:uncharacterized protein (DUF433 family)